MKKIMYQHLPLSSSFILLFFLFLSAGCKKSDSFSSLNAQNQSSLSAQAIQRVDLVANKSIYGALHIDHNLLNAWGMSADDEGNIWVSAADGGISYVYNKKGGHEMPPISIPSHEANTAGNPTGNTYNETDDFIIWGTGEKAELLFASEDGTVSAWNNGPSAVVVADRSGQGASYKGIAIANDGGTNFLYVTDFGNASVDVLDKNFQYVTGKPFNDPNIPSGYAPFGIREINNMLYVTYALRTEDGEDSTGLGLGIVDVFWPNGTLSKRFASYGTLNAPWGITEARPGFMGNNNSIFIGNFGDGHINMYDLNGNFQGLLMNQGNPVAIEGLWAIDTGIPDVVPQRLYFTAGPNDESDGIFGFLMKK